MWWAAFHVQLKRMSIEQSRLRQSFPPKLKRWLREPLLHFLLLGVVLFAAYAYMQRGRGGVERAGRGRDEGRQRGWCDR